MNPGSARTISLTVVALAAITVVYFLFDPATAGWFPKCPWHQITGWQCPGCGSQRAIHSLLTLHPLDALRHNALLPIAIPLAALVIYLEAFRPRPLEGLRRRLTSHRLILGTLIAIVLWTILRNIVNI